MFILMPIMGLAQGAQPILGFNFGARHMDRVKRTLRLAIVAATAVALAGFALAELFPGPLMSAFSTDPNLLEIGRRGMRISFLTFPLIGVGVIVGSFFQAIGRAKTALFLTLSRQVIILIPLLLILPRRWGLDGLWSAGPISDLASSLLTMSALVYQLRVLSRSPAQPAPETLTDTDPAIV
jgi:Na+-driven multidrug efflux pump